MVKRNTNFDLVRAAAILSQQIRPHSTSEAIDLLEPSYSQMTGLDLLYQVI